VDCLVYEKCEGEAGGPDPKYRILDLQLKSASENFLDINPWAFEYNKDTGYEPKVKM